jgi:hypothetical protein
MVDGCVDEVIALWTKVVVSWMNELHCGPSRGFLAE